MKEGIVKKMKTVVAYLAKNGVQVIYLSKKDIRELDRATQKIINGVVVAAQKKEEKQLKRAMASFRRKGYAQVGTNFRKVIRRELGRGK